jgi:hypothetical protein
MRRLLSRLEKFPFWEMAMKAASILVAGLAVTTLSIAPATAAQPANAAPTSFPSATTPWIGCSLASGHFSPTCRNVGNFKTYNECKEASAKVGGRDNENAWYCTSLAPPDSVEEAGNKCCVGKRDAAERFAGSYAGLRWASGSAWPSSEVLDSGCDEELVTRSVSAP